MFSERTSTWEAPLSQDCQVIRQTSLTLVRLKQSAADCTPGSSQNTQLARTAEFQLQAAVDYAVLTMNN